MKAKETKTAIQETMNDITSDRSRFYTTVKPPASSYSDLLLNTLLQQMSQGVLLVRLDGCIELCNHAAARILNMNAEDLCNKSFWTYLPDDFCGRSMKDSLRMGLSHRLVYRGWPCQTDTSKEVEIKELEISSSFLNSLGLLIFLRDITSWQKLQKAAHHQDTLRELGEMTAIAAHEIRNTLGGIRGFAALLQRDLQKDVRLYELTTHLIEGIRTLERNTTSILQASRSIKLDLQSLELVSFLKNLGRFIQMDPSFPSQVQLEIHTPREEICAVLDPQAVKSCLLNLIYNAFQAMPHGGKLQITLLRSADLCQFFVSDTGVGIPPETLEHIFRPSFTTKQQGHGFGLSESKKIAQAHGGQLDARSQPGRGSTFTLTLPLFPGTGKV